MKLGMLLHGLSRRPVVLGLSLVVAAIAAVFSAYRITVSPPGLHARSIGMAAASTQVLVDNPYSIVLDLNQGSYQLQQLAQSATLLGDVMVSLPVREDIARRRRSRRPDPDLGPGDAAVPASDHEPQSDDGRPPVLQ